MANGLNEHFSSIARNITTKLNKHSSDKLHNKTPTHYLLQFFQTSFPNFTLQTVSTNEITNTIRSLKSKNSLVMLGELEYPDNLESYAVGSVVTGRVTLGRHVEG